MDISTPENLPRLYTDLAQWFHLLTAPEDYAEEAEFFYQALLAASDRKPETMLELGSGGGNNASHLKSYLKLTLVDISAQMLDISLNLNPECEHIQGDMRTIRLEQTFDAVFVHDAIGYMNSEEDLHKVIETANMHCRPGGVILLAPDHVQENYRPSTSHGGHDGEERGIRYLEWTWDPDPDDTDYISHMVYVMKNERGQVRIEHDQHTMGIFPRQTWLDIISNQGLRPEVIQFDHSELEPGTYEIFVARK
jgi:SAM-dependent methyltransferase